MRNWLAIACIVLAVSPALAPSPALAYEPVDKANVPEIKRTKLGLYLTAPEAYALKNAEGDKALFVDIRTRGEFQFLGSPTVTDANVPYVEMEDPPAWDGANKRYKLSPNSDFTAAVAARLEKAGLGKDAPVILMCRSGDRSAKAADLLAQAGFTKVFSVLDGFEGDIGKAGRRDVNGWKNAELPWTYQMDEKKAYLR